jgi:hypothetical protein
MRSKAAIRFAMPENLQHASVQSRCEVCYVKRRLVTQLLSREQDRLVIGSQANLGLTFIETNQQ